MPGAVYSTQFANGDLASSSTTFYIVPTGKVAVIRDMTVGYATLARTGGQISVQLGASNSRIWIVQVPASTAGSDHWTGYLVLPAGEQLRAFWTATGGCRFTASGFLLNNP